MAENNLSDEELRAVRKLIEDAEALDMLADHADFIKEDIQYKKALRLLAKRWKAFVIGLAATLTAGVYVANKVHGWLVSYIAKLAG